MNWFGAYSSTVAASGDLIYITLESREGSIATELTLCYR